MMFQALFLVLESTFHAQGTQLQNFLKKKKNCIQQSFASNGSLSQLHISYCKLALLLCSYFFLNINSIICLCVIHTVHSQFIWMWCS